MLVFVYPIVSGELLHTVYKGTDAVRVGGL